MRRLDRVEDREKGLALLEELIRIAPRERRVFTTQSLCFLMVGSYLVERWSLASGLRVLLETGAKKLLGSCKRVRNGEHSRNTSGLSQARSKLMLEPLREILSELVRRLTGRGETWHGRVVKTLDGSGELLLPREELRLAYPPTSNQFGESAYPMMMLTVCHDTLSGVLEDYEVGPLNGEKQENELQQSLQIMSRMERGSVVMADRAHGILKMVRHAKNEGLDVVYRLTDERAKKVLNGSIVPGIDRIVEWSPSKAELKKYPEWNEGERVKGRIISRRIVKSNKEFLLVLFTTLGKEEYPADEIVELYARRWEIEGEIRDLKKTIGLSEISAHTSAMIEKEVVAAMIAYNIVRAVILAAAERYGIEDPKQVSFKNAYEIVRDTTWRLLEAGSQTERQRLIDSALDWIAARINKPRPGRSYPRTAYKVPATYPSKKRQLDGSWT